MISNFKIVILVSMIEQFVSHYLALKWWKS